MPVALFDVVLALGVTGIYAETIVVVEVYFVHFVPVISKGTIFVGGATLGMLWVRVGFEGGEGELVFFVHG